MNRPLDPRKHGKAPKKVYAKTESIITAHETTLDDLNDQWQTILSYHRSQNHRIVSGPILSQGGYTVALTFQYEWDNLNYECEKAQWDFDIIEYERRLGLWKIFDAERKKSLAADSKNIELQIARTEQRLANLRAVQAGQPIPFPPKV